RHTRSKRDWSSDVCSSDLIVVLRLVIEGELALLVVARQHGRLAGPGVEHVTAPSAAVGRLRAALRVRRLAVERTAARALDGHGVRAWYAPPGKRQITAARGRPPARRWAAESPAARSRPRRRSAASSSCARRRR